MEIDRRRKLMALSIVVLLLLAGGVVLLFRPGMWGTTPRQGAPATPMVPFVICDPQCNPDIDPGPAPVNEVDIGINPVDPLNMIVSGNDYNTSTGLHWLGVYWSKDGGKNWNHSMLEGCPGCPDNQLSTFAGSGDPVIVYGADGTAYLAGIASGDRDSAPIQRLLRRDPLSVTLSAISTDGGATWSNIAYQGTAYTRLTFHDKEWIEADPNSQYVYMAWIAFEGAVTSRMQVSTSADGGRTWGTPVIYTELRQLELNTQGATPMVGADGTLVVAFIDYQKNQMMAVRSHDHGATFDSPTPVCPVTPINRNFPEYTFRTPTIPQGVVDRSGGPHDGRYYLTWEDMASGNSDIQLTYSDDGGVTWSDPMQVNNDNTTRHQFFSDVAVGTNSSVHLVWYDARNTTTDSGLEVYYAESTDGALTFPVQFPVTDNPFEGNDAGETSTGAHGHPLGDYIGIDTSKDTVVMTWPDPRNQQNGDGNTDIFVARVRYAYPTTDGNFTVPSATPMNQTIRGG